MRANAVLSRSHRIVEPLAAILLVLAALVVAPAASAGPSTSQGWYSPLNVSLTSENFRNWLGSSCNGQTTYISGLYHIGVDASASVGAPVSAIGAGVVRYYSTNGWGTGNVGLGVEHTAADGSKFIAVYGHIVTGLRAGAAVNANQQIGTVGAHPNGNHLHFGIRPGTTLPSSNWGAMPCSSWPSTNGFVDPLPYLVAHPLAAYVGHIVKWDGDPVTSWYVGSDGNRRWIPNALIYGCLRAHGAPVTVLSAAQLDKIRDLTGQSAVCENPFGAFDSVAESSGLSGAGVVRVRGWAADPNLPNGPLSVHVYANGQHVASIAANKSRTDVASVYPGYGTNLGYDSTVALPTGGGTVNVCTYAINAGAGNTNTGLGCKSVSVRNPNPFGAFDSVAESSGLSGAGVVRVRGWAADPNLPNGPLSVHVYANGQYVASITANKSRTDVASANPGYGTNLGYDSTVALPTGGGTVNVCTYAINAGAGNTNTRLGCKSVSVRNPNPFGAFDSASTTTGQVRVRGWAADPNLPNGPLSVHVYANGQYVASITANKSRTDVASANPGYGTNLGYDSTLNVSQRGVVTVCTYAINAGAGNANTSLGCKSVSVP